MHARPFKQELIAWLHEVNDVNLSRSDAKWLAEITDKLQKEGKIRATLAGKKSVCELIALLLKAVPQLTTEPEVERSLYEFCKRNQLLSLLPDATVEPTKSFTKRR